MLQSADHAGKAPLPCRSFAASADGYNFDDDRVRAIGYRVLAQSCTVVTTNGLAPLPCYLSAVSDQLTPFRCSCRKVALRRNRSFVRSAAVRQRGALFSAVQIGSVQSRIRHSIIQLAP